MLDKIVVGVDGSPTSARILDWCVELLSETDCEAIVVCCHVARPELGDDGNDALRAELRTVTKSACKKLSARGVRCRDVVEDGDARVALIEIAEREGAGLIVAGSRGRSQLKDVVLGSVATYLTHQSPIPVAVVR